MRAAARLLAVLILAAPVSAIAQEKHLIDPTPPGSLNPEPLPPLQNPDAPSTPAKELFARKPTPFPGPFAALMVPKCSATVVRILPASTSPATLSRSACCSTMSAVCSIERVNIDSQWIDTHLRINNASSRGSLLISASRPWGAISSRISLRWSAVWVVENTNPGAPMPSAATCAAIGLPWSMT